MFRTPGHILKELRDLPPQTNQGVSPIQGGTNHHVVRAQRVEGLAQDPGINAGDIRPRDHDGVATGPPSLNNAALHAFAQIPVSLRLGAKVIAKSMMHPGGVGPFNADLNTDTAHGGQLRGHREDVPGHGVLKTGGRLRPHRGDEACLGFPGLGIAREHAEPLLDCIAMGHLCATFSARPSTWRTAS